MENIRGLKGTAVNVQAMAYGNMGDDCGTGVAFTRNPSTGENKFYGEFLVNAQGEDVVAGIRTPQPVDEMPKWNKKVYHELLKIKKTLEKHYKDMQDIEFTIEGGKLFMLQTRNGKRTGAAAVKIACDMVAEKLIDRQTAVLRVPAGDLTQLLLPSFDAMAKKSAQILSWMTSSMLSATALKRSSNHARSSDVTDTQLQFADDCTEPRRVFGAW